jgi:hypothetical protein
LAQSRGRPDSEAGEPSLKAAGVIQAVAANCNTHLKVLAETKPKKPVFGIIAPHPEAGEPPLIQD